MTEINYRDLKKYLTVLKRDPKKNAASPVYLIHGEELLYKTAFDELLDVLLPQEDRSLYYEPVDGDQENLPETIEKVNTFSLLSSRKVVGVRDSRIFYSKDDRPALVEKAKAAFAADDLKTAAKHVLDLLGVSRLDYEDISDENPAASMKLDVDGLDDDDWLAKTIEYCKAQRLAIPDRRDRADLLQQAVEKGFPAGNCLVLTTDQVDRRRSLYKAIDTVGMIIDCSVPKGDRRADRSAQDAVLNEQMNAMLAKTGKTLAAGAYQALVEMTGFDLRAFSSGLEKLISYTGDRREITRDDVAAVLQRTKKDPIYELTNAVADRSVEAALFYIRSLLDDGLHPLQIFAAIVNQVRKLLIVKDFVTSDAGGAWRTGLSFEGFRSRVLPAIQAYDQSLLELIEDWRPAGGQTAKKKKAAARPKTELLIARNPANSYPVYVMLQKSDQFEKTELITAMQTLNETDLLLKSSPLSPKLVLEKAVLAICRNA